MGTEKRTLIAIILSIIILVGYQFLFPTPPQKQPVTGQTKEEKKESKLQEPVKPVSLPVSTPAVSPSEEKEVRIETGLYSATLSSIGGTIKKWELKSIKIKMGCLLSFSRDRVFISLSA